jgi:uncharacterized membrane protein YczE
MTEMKKRVIMCVAGVLLSGVAAGTFGFTAFGMDPFQVLAHGTWTLTPLSFGTFYVVLNGLLLLFMVIFNRRMIGLGTIINLFILGYVVEYTELLLGRLFPSPSVVLRAVLMILALVLASFAASLYFVADMGVSAYDWIALTLSDRKGWPFRVVRVSTDLICVVIGGLLGAAVGIGTVLTAFCMGPVIQFFNDHISSPLRYGKKGSE